MGKYSFIFQSTGKHITAFALGNVMDRIIYGYVVDFIDIYYQTWHWPAFNIADIGISIGAVMLLIDAIIFKQE